MPLIYARFFPRNGYRIADGSLRFEDRLADKGDLPAFIGLMKQHGFTAIREFYGDNPKLLLQMDALLSTPLEVVTLRNERIAVDIVPALAGRVLRIVDVSSDQCLTAYNRPRSLYFPFCGGLESRVGEQFRQSGWMELAAVTERGQASVTMTLRTGDGFVLTRTVTLMPDAPVVEIRSVLTNPGTQARPARLRSHLELDMGTLRATRVGFTDRAGKRVEREAAAILAGLREGEAYRAQGAPKAAWTFVGDKGLRLTQRVREEQVDFTRLYAFPEDLGELEAEVWGKATVLEPGQSTALEEAIEIER